MPVSALRSSKHATPLRAVADAHVAWTGGGPTLCHTAIAGPATVYLSAVCMQSHANVSAARPPPLCGLARPSDDCCPRASQSETPSGDDGTEDKGDEGKGDDGSVIRAAAMWILALVAAAGLIGGGEALSRCVCAFLSVRSSGVPSSSRGSGFCGDDRRCVLALRLADAPIVGRAVSVVFDDAPIQRGCTDQQRW